MNNEKSHWGGGGAKRSERGLLGAKGFQIAVERREAKSKGEKERYSHMNAEFERIARRD